jgi:putative lipoprotein
MKRLAFASAAVAIALSMMSCSSSKEVKNDSAGASWKVIQMGAKMLDGMDASMLPTMAFDPIKKSVTGSTGCNNYNGTFEQNPGGLLKFGPVAMTRKACTGEAASTETMFLDVLKRVSKMEVKDDVLMLMDSAGVELLKAKASE